MQRPKSCWWSSPVGLRVTGPSWQFSVTSRVTPNNVQKYLVLYPVKVLGIKLVSMLLKGIHMDSTYISTISLVLEKIFVFLVFIFGIYLLWSEAGILSSVLSNYSWQCMGDQKGCCGSKLDLQCGRKVP